MVTEPCVDVLARSGVDTDLRAVVGSPGGAPAPGIQPGPAPAARIPARESGR
ncbi:hypothetical protein [Actinomadura craniellae]|uniref:hypothetical protein n=1 Tax=Actinomadura craniellae TaxID=2231787 RepID=UPI001314035C|nr:hypothetical protein [Actinomadura craniellae]